MMTVAGAATSRGFVAGPVFLCVANEEVAQVQYTLPEGGVMAELARFHAARAVTREQLQQLSREVAKNSSVDDAHIFENHLVMLDDVMVIDEVERIVRTERINCEAALRKVLEQFRAIFGKMNDAYLRERVRDIDDLERRLLRNLAGKEDTVFDRITEPVIVVADDLTPSETVSLPRNLILGFATDRGSTTSHAALLARSLGIPAVVGLGDITKRVKVGDYALLDGSNGAITINPDQSTREEFARLKEREGELQELLATQMECASSPCTGSVKLLANVQPGGPLTNLAAFGAQGIGLYRSEYLWLSSKEEPDEETQVAAYTEAVRAVNELGAAQVTFRCLDLGGDKLLHKNYKAESNPFLGNRSIRYLLSNRDVFRTQLRAILRTSALGHCAVMYPMVATLSELREANAELNAMMQELRTEGVAFDEHLPRGMMVEVPSAALNAEIFAREVDFFSVGTNDLIQYAMAADRGNEQVAHLYQPFNPAVLKLMDITARAAAANHIPMAVCGESASDPIVGVLWLGFGATELSMSASCIPVMKKVLSSLAIDDAHLLADEVRNMWNHASAADIALHCRDFLYERIPTLEAIQSFFTTT